MPEICHEFQWETFYDIDMVYNITLLVNTTLRSASAILKVSHFGQLHQCHSRLSAHTYCLLFLSNILMCLLV